MRTAHKAIDSMNVANIKNKSDESLNQSIVTQTPSGWFSSVFNRQKSASNLQQNNNNNNNNTPQYFNDMLDYLLKKYEKVKHLQPTAQKPAIDKAWERYTQRLLHYAAIHKFMVEAMKAFKKHEKIADVINFEFKNFLLSDKLPAIEGSSFAGFKTSSEEYLTLVKNLQSISSNELITQFQAVEEQLSTMLIKNYPIQTLYIQLDRDINNPQNINTDVNVIANVSSDEEDQNTSYDPYDNKTGVFEL